VLFEDEQGFKDALTGVYIDLASNGMYAREFTMATMDVLAQQYDVAANSHAYYETGRYNYTDGAVKGRIDQFWHIGYRAIANINNLLAAIDEKKSVFSAGMYERIKGEALGLRAFVHFDLFRVFGPVPTSGFAGKEMPYLTTFTKQVSPNLTGTDFLDACFRDIDQAIDLLEKDKEVVYGVADPFVSHTRNHLNFWAAHGLKARMSLYKGDMELAYKHARYVIDNKGERFPFIERNNLVSTAPYRTFLPEHLFGIYVSTLEDTNKGLFKSTAGTSVLTNTAAFIANVFEGSSTDYRSVFLWKIDGGVAQYYPAKYWVDDIQTNTLNVKRIPLIRLSEMYYIAAETSKTLEEKIDLLNAVRTHRGIAMLANTLEAAQVNAEIFKEYRKEFYQEGQLFFYYKRTNTLRIEGYGYDMDESTYVLPRPDDEIEFNNL
jgi:hypothetical protein